MGLDQFAYFVEDESRLHEDGRVEDFYWRKHNRLQGWMEGLWRSKGNKGEFNCEDLELTMDDLITLQHDIEEKDLPEVDSYENYDDWRKENDENFIKSAINAIKDGHKVFYSCCY